MEFLVGKKGKHGKQFLLKWILNATGASSLILPLRASWQNGLILSM